MQINNYGYGHTRIKSTFILGNVSAASCFPYCFTIKISDDILNCNFISGTDFEHSFAHRHRNCRIKGTDIWRERQLEILGGNAALHAIRNGTDSTKALTSNCRMLVDMVKISINRHNSSCIDALSAKHSNKYQY